MDIIVLNCLPGIRCWNNGCCVFFAADKEKRSKKHQKNSRHVYLGLSSDHSHDGKFISIPATISN